MPISPRRFAPIGVLALALVLGVPAAATAQADPFNFEFSSGQTVAPFFDGWSRNADGSYQMHFGYINRNHVEEVHVPIGADNRVEPGERDQGQPTFFYPRMYRKTFSVRVPSDWDDKELVWNLRVRGQLQQAIGWLDPVWEIDPILNGRLPTEEQRINQPPTLVVTSDARTVRLPQTLALTATVHDADGLPTPREVTSSIRGPRAPSRRARGQETPPTLQPQPGEPKAPVNVPALRTRVRPSPIKVDDRLTIIWSVWRGPASVQIDSDSVQGETVGMTATFTEPGEYVLRAKLSDGHLTDTEDVPVTVTPSR